jgi:nucleoside-diphosphate kinase
MNKWESGPDSDEILAGVASVERTLLLIKPDGVRRGLIGEVLRRVERAGLRISALNMRRPTEEIARGHYLDDDRQLLQMGGKLLSSADALGLDVEEAFGTREPLMLGRIIFERNVEFLASGPVVVAVVVGPHAISKMKLMCGATMPHEASPGSIRGDFASVGAEQVLGSSGTVENLIHVSDREDGSVDREIDYWFK